MNHTRTTPLPQTGRMKLLAGIARVLNERYERDRLAKTGAQRATKMRV